MLLICDINEYRKCVKGFSIALLDQLFNTLHALCNLLVVVPENLKQVCSGEELVCRVYIYIAPLHGVILKNNINNYYTKDYDNIINSLYCIFFRRITVGR